MNKSRKFAALLIILMILGGVLHAQVNDDEPHGLYIEKPKPIFVGLVAGANFAQVDGDNYAGYRKIGANVGGIGYIQVYKHLSFSFEILYSQKGAKSDIVRFSTIDSTTAIVKYGIKLNYAEIPIMINYFDQRKSHFGIGLSYGRLVASSEMADTEPHYNIDLNQYPFKKDSYELIAGAQLHIWEGLFLNIRFQYALAPVRTSAPVAFARQQKQYNNLWTVRLMYLFI